MSKWTDFVKSNMSAEMKRANNDHGKAMKVIGKKWKTSPENPKRVIPNKKTSKSAKTVKTSSTTAGKKADLMATNVHTNKGKKRGMGGIMKRSAHTTKKAKRLKLTKKERAGMKSFIKKRR